MVATTMVPRIFAGFLLPLPTLHAVLIFPCSSLQKPEDFDSCIVFMSALELSTFIFMSILLYSSIDCL